MWRSARKPIGGGGGQVRPLVSGQDSGPAVAAVELAFPPMGCFGMCFIPGPMNMVQRHAGVPYGIVQG